MYSSDLSGLSVGCISILIDMLIKVKSYANKHDGLMQHIELL